MRALRDRNSRGEICGFERAAAAESGQVGELRDEKGLAGLASVVFIETQNDGVRALDPAHANLDLGDRVIGGRRESVGDPLGEGLIGDVAAEDSGPGGAVIDVGARAQIAVDGHETGPRFGCGMRTVNGFDVDEVASAVNGGDAIFALGEGWKASEQEKKCWDFHESSWVRS